jgi:hypothetical protein
MSYASKAGRARISSRNPQALGICDRCGLTYNHVNLQWQYDWRGSTMQNVRILVCRQCLDVPQEQQRAIVVPADPVPIMNARVENWSVAETDYRVTTSIPTTDPTTGLPVYTGSMLLTQNGQNLTTQPIGPPVGLDQGAVMPFENGNAYRVRLTPLSVISYGNATVGVTFGTPHGLAPNDQISVEGLSNRYANGSYSITVTTATQFTYQTNTALPGGSLMTDTMLMVTANIGIPRDYDQIPQTGIGPFSTTQPSSQGVYDYGIYDFSTFASEPYGAGIWSYSLWGGSLWG